MLRNMYLNVGKVVSISQHLSHGKTWHRRPLHNPQVVRGMRRLFRFYVQNPGGSGAETASAIKQKLFLIYVARVCLTLRHVQVSSTYIESIVRCILLTVYFSSPTLLSTVLPLITRLPIPDNLRCFI